MRGKTMIAKTMIVKTKIVKTKIVRQMANLTLIKFLLLPLVFTMLACQDGPFSIDLRNTNETDLRTKIDIESNPTYSFEQFLEAEPETGSPENFATLLFQSQSALNADFLRTSDDPDGRCLMMLTATEPSEEAPLESPVEIPAENPEENPEENPQENPEENPEENGPLTSLEALAQGGMQVSESGMLLYSEPNQQSSECVAVMSGVLEGQYETNINSIYISFYRN